MNYVFGYGRASTDTQKITLQNQEAVCLKWYDLQRSMGKLEDYDWGGWYCDADTTSRIKWFERPKGEELVRDMRKGDRIVVTNYDRAFRSVVDCSNSLEMLNEAGVSLVILDADFDTSTILGRACMKMIAIMKEVERESIGQRTKDALAWKKSQGLPVGKIAPIGWKVDHGKFVVDDRGRGIAQLTLELHQEGLSHWDIAMELNRRRIRRYWSKKFTDWQPNSVKRYIDAIKAGFPIYGRAYPAPAPGPPADASGPSSGAPESSAPPVQSS